MDKRRPYAIDLTEEKANEYVAKTLLVFSAVLVFAFLLNELDVFKITKSTSSINIGSSSENQT